MTSSELSTLLGAVRDLGTRLDSRIDRLEDTVIEKHEERISVLEDAHLVRSGASQERGKILGMTRSTVATLVSVAAAITAIVSVLTR